jgi:hypothetical protein
MKKPEPKPHVRCWTEWPQSFARHEEIGLGTRGRYATKGRGHRLLLVAERLAARSKTPIDGIVVFYPRHMNNAINSHLWFLKQRLGIDEYLKRFKGLTICATPRLVHVAIAFRIEDVENHRTPADAYYLRAYRTEAERNRCLVDPAPIYTAEENEGREIHQ